MPGAVVALSIGFGAAFASFPVLALRKEARLVIIAGLSLAIFALPLLVPETQPFIRWLVAIASLTLVVKLYDLHASTHDDAAAPDLLGYAAFLFNTFSLVWRKQEAHRRATRRDNFTAAVCYGAAAVLGVALLIAIFKFDWSRRPFILEHAAKILGFYAAMLPITGAAASLWQLAGGRGCQFMDNPLLSRTPAEFWRRYNCPVYQFFHENVFKPAGGRQSPVRATLLVFLISGIAHEYIFAIAIGKVQGYQLLFFLLQGCAVALTLRVKPRGWRAAGWRAGTFLFNMASAVIFCLSMQGIVPFYSH